MQTNLIHQSATLRFYAELNELLPKQNRQKELNYSFLVSPSIKDVIESFGIPHTEVDLILVNGHSVDFSYRLQDQDHISVYPVFESMDISPLVQLRAKPLRRSRFILDTHLGKLARLLRMLGLDALYRNDYQDEEIIAKALEDHRIILTCDRGILKNSRVTHGYCLRSRFPNQQLKEVLTRFDLRSQILPLRRCIACNGTLQQVKKSTIQHRLLPRTKRYYENFQTCPHCGKIYWRGSHYSKMQSYLHKVLKEPIVPNPVDHDAHPTPL